jgi:hypothetical protein
VIFGGCEEMLGKVGSQSSGYSASAYVPGYGDGHEQESEKAEDRDCKEDIHASVEG